MPHPHPAYHPLSSYGLIGDCRTAALVSSAGSVDWLCAPDFDSPSIFARLIDARRGGYFSIKPADAFESDAAYLDDSAVMRTTFNTGSGTVALTDFMPLKESEERERIGLPSAGRRMIRLLQGVAGAVELRLDCRPRPDYGLRPPRITRGGAEGLSLGESGKTQFFLQSSVPLSANAEHVEARCSLSAGERAAFVLDWSGDAHSPSWSDPAHVCRALEATLAFWREWHKGCRYRGPYYGPVMRSLATLKLLTYAPSGAMVAAPTTSLPEEIGGVRNWDYRYTWIRDASLSFHALLHAGHEEDTRRFMRWVCETALRCNPGDLQILYGLRGRRALPERALDHLDGYRGSRPVRLGNASSTQFQLDVYGELLDCFEVLRASGELPESEAKAIWPAFAGQVDAVAARWREPDSGIWEVRSEPRHFVHSKVMAWVALDRGVRAVKLTGLPGDVARWEREREAVREEVMRLGYQEGGGFLQSYDSGLPDAANLLLPIVGFVPASHPCMGATLDAIQRTLVKNGLVYRYRGIDDGVPGDEATFAVCTFWLVENLAARGQVDEASALFEAMLARATPLGLYAEQIDPRTGAHLGNFPQALTHIGLVNAANALARAGATGATPVLKENHESAHPHDTET